MTLDLLQEKYGHNLDDVLLEEIAETGITKTFEKNDIIIDIDQTLLYIPLLLSGHIKVLREDDAGNELLIYVLHAGETCTMTLTCCMGTQKSKIRAVAEKKSTLLMIPVEKMANWFHNNDSWRNFILESYQMRFDEMLQTIDNIAFMKMDERLLKYLKNKAGLHNSNTIHVIHQEIAEDLHTSRVVVSRLLKQLEINKKINLSRNKIEILDL